MSVSLCAFRMEIANGHTSIHFEHYQAPKLLRMASGGAPGESAGDAGGSRSRTFRHHDRRLTARVTVETVIPQLVQCPGTSLPPDSHCDSGAVHGAEAATPPAGASRQSSPASAAVAATSSATDGTPPAAEPGGAGGEASPPPAEPGRAGSAASPPAAEPGGAASPPTAEPGRAGGEASPSAAERGRAGGEASPPAAERGRAGGEASPPAAEPAAARRDRDRAARQQDGDVLMGPSGTAVSYAELVKSGREPPRTSKELTSEQPQLQQKPFISGNPFVEVTQGLLHLYKENAMTSLEDGVERSEMICMLSVPAKMVIHDLLQFTAACYPDMERMRIIRDNTPNQYMVLLKFRTQTAADEFYRNFNGVAYNSLEPETCRLVYVSRVDLVNESDEARLPIPGFTELPTCPVCLERMDESVDGVLTVLCNHSFHGSCLSQWGDTSCPVCRYVQTPELVEDNFCFECQAGESLWICLICGHVGCGRYVGGHAYSHFLDTGHTYTMRVGSTRVWDYVGDNFVHRLVQNNDDGKMVEVDRGGPGADRDHKQDDCGEKLEGIQLEYTYLLTSQLQSQRQYYEECIARIEKEAQQEAEDLKERARTAVEQTVSLKEKLQQVSAGRTSSENKVSQLSQRMSRCLKELQEEREMNKSLRENQACWQQRVQQLETKMAASNQQKDKELSELRDQVRDLMFFLEAQQKIASSSAVLQQELAEGNIVVPDTPPPAKHGGARKKKR